MGLFTDIAQLFMEGYGWLFLILLGGYELYAPRFLDQDTALAPIVRDVPDKVDDLSEQQDEFRDNLDDVQSEVTEVQSRQKVQMQVQRAQARANEQMDAEAVDKYLLENGVEPNEFLHGNEMSGYANWGQQRDTDADEQ